ncbi:MAG: hypothetical protein MIO93_04945 [ANME-2 cluster archaeon]|nr:hypothetical protein [ANME-2 cluster archaeon]
MLKDGIFAWHATLVAGKYQLVLDMDEYGSGVYSEIPGYAESVYDPLGTFTVVQVNQAPDVSEAYPCIAIAS